MLRLHINKMEMTFSWHISVTLKSWARQATASGN